ncbi:MAG: hypothetical protein IKJ67_10875 [Bacteroidales bacterium]|nr:hypothetical protein [Bacteroidales bacterium]
MKRLNTLLRSFTFFGLLFLGSQLLFATEQIPDYIIYKGEKYTLDIGWGHPSPLEVYYIRTGISKPFSSYSTANYRGHVATWEIRDSGLYLLTIDTKIYRTHTGLYYSEKRHRPKDTIVAPGFYSITSLNKTEDNVTEIVFADWFSGVLEIDNRGANSKWNDEYKGTRYIYIKDGKVVDDQLLTKEDYDRFQTISDKDTSDHEFMAKYIIAYLNNCYLSFWFQSGMNKDALLYKDNKGIVIQDEMSPFMKLFNNNPIEYPFNWENFATNGAPVCTWSVDGDSIFLNNLSISRGLDFYDNPKIDIPLHDVFIPERFIDNKVFAYWMNGELEIKYGREVKGEFGTDEYYVERVQKIVLDSGRVVSNRIAPCGFDTSTVRNPLVVCGKSGMHISQYSPLGRFYRDSLNPKVMPQWADGDSALQSWFDAQPLTDEMSQIQFRALIEFVVSCEGKAGNWALLGVDGDFEYFYTANKILDIVTKLPQRWQPAMDEKGNPVDCRMLMKIDVIDGKIKLGK